MRREVIAGNWKMFKTAGETREFFRSLLPAIEDGVDRDVILAPPFTALAAAAESVHGTPVSIAAQDVHWESDGAFTGEVSVPMLRDAGCEYVILGHSERRQLFGETNPIVSKKVTAVVGGGMKAIVCVGETLEERDAGRAEATVRTQLSEGLAQLTVSDLSHIMVAYEPVWAIGTGKTATPDIAQRMHRSIRADIGAVFGESSAQSVRVLYGGSVKPGNIADLMAQPDIDGALVGGASLDPASFLAIVRYREARQGPGYSS